MPQPVEHVVHGGVRNPKLVLVKMNQDVDAIVRNVKYDNLGGQNNLAKSVRNQKVVLAQNGLNVDMHRPNIISALAGYVLQIELPMGWKISKFTKFVGDISGSIVEHIPCYLTEAGNIANNVNLRMKYFSNSLSKNTFT